MIVHLYQTSANVTKYQKEVYYKYLAVKVFNMLPVYIKTASDIPKKFNVLSQKLLRENSFYSLDEYFKLRKSSVFTYDLDRHVKVLGRVFFLIFY